LTATTGTPGAQFPAEAVAPAFGFAAAYNLPNAPTYCLRVLEVVNPGRLPWKIEGRQILTDLSSPLQITFIQRITNVELMDPLFRDALATRLAMEWAEKLTRSTDIKTMLEKEYQAKIREARSIDGQEGTLDDVMQTTWIDARW